MPQLKAVEFGFNKFCGPAVLSILTGRSTDECARVIQSINGQYDIRGVLLTDLLRAANKLGFDQINVDVNNMSLFRALITLAPKGDATYIVTVPNHFVCVEVAANKIYFCDNHTKEPIPAASSARLQMLVINVHRIVKRTDFVEPVKPKPKEFPASLAVEIQIDGIWFRSYTQSSDIVEKIGKLQSHNGPIWIRNW